MSKIIFNFGTMNASKSAQLLMTAHNYEEKGETPILIKPGIDDRSEDALEIYSRVGISAYADIIEKSTPIDWNELNDAWEVNERPSAILVDEAQFISKESILAITGFARDMNISVFAYGLLKDFRNELFESSKIWLQEADNFTEIKTSCKYCNRKATINARFVNNRIVVDGPTILIGAEESYVSVCRKHFDYYQNHDLEKED